jgi:hypothetical protein
MPLKGGGEERKMQKAHHVVPNHNGGWGVKRAGSHKASVHTQTKQDAVDLGRAISRNQGTEFVIRGKDGKIQQSDSLGHDPFPPRG